MLVKEGLPLEGCGIYAIHNILSGKVYVGSSVRMNRRYKDHSGALYKNKHTNKQLQKEYNDSPEAFYFEVLEYCTEKEIINRENYWIKEKDSVENGFNIQKESHNNGSRSKKTSKAVTKMLKNRDYMKEFYSNMQLLSLYKDRSLPEGVMIRTRGFNITPNETTLQPQRLAKFSRMIIKIMGEVYALTEGVYTLHYVNYIAGEGKYDLWEYEPKKPCKNRAVKTDQIYDRFIELIYEDLNYTELGRRCIEGMDKQGIELRKYDAEKIEDLYGE